MAHVDHVEKSADGREIVITHEVSDEFIIVRRVLYYLLDIIELLIVTRFLLKIFGANPASGFVSFMYSLTEPLIAPFRNIFTAVATGPGVFEWASLIAIIAYATLTYLLIRLIRLIR